jgi:chromate transporter
MVTALSTLFLTSAPPKWVAGAAAGAGAAVAAVAVRAGIDLVSPSFKRAAQSRARRVRWMLYAALGVAAAASVGGFVVLVLLVCGAAELGIRAGSGSRRVDAHALPGAIALVAAAVAGVGGVGALAWVAFKVGALSYGGGFVIVPLMRTDAVHTYHWMTSAQFLSAVALGQVTPGPVVATVAAVGYAAHGVAGAILAAIVAFLPSFVFVLIGGGHFERLRRNARAGAFLEGAGPAAIGAILGSAIPLASALSETWQFIVLAAAAVALLILRRGIVITLVASGAVGVLVALAGGPLPG